MKTSSKVIGTLALVIVLALAGFFYFRFYYVFGDGVKAGELNQLTYKGYIWKTYEGRVIQAGFKGATGRNVSGVSVESYIFDFSVADHAIAEELMRCSGKNVELHYKEYLGSLPWRGKQKHIVDKILSVSDNYE